MVFQLYSLVFNLNYFSFYCSFPPSDINCKQFLSLYINLLAKSIDNKSPRVVTGMQIIVIFLDIYETALFTKNKCNNKQSQIWSKGIQYPCSNFSNSKYGNKQLSQQLKYESI